MATSRLHINLESGPILAILLQAIQKAINPDGFPSPAPLTISSLLLFANALLCFGFSAGLFSAPALPLSIQEIPKDSLKRTPAGRLTDILSESLGRMRLEQDSFECDLIPFNRSGYEGKLPGSNHPRPA